MPFSLLALWVTFFVATSAAHAELAHPHSMADMPMEMDSGMDMKMDMPMDMDMPMSHEAPMDTSHGAPDHDMGDGPKLGHYFGYLKLEGMDRKVAASLDLLEVQSGSDTQRLEAIVRVSLGGFFSREYSPQSYDRLSYSYEKKFLTLYDGGNDLVLTLTPHGNHLMGEAKSVSANLSGAAFFSLDPKDLSSETTPFLPSLAGEYRGKCGNTWAYLTVLTARGLEDTEDQNVRRPFLHYRLAGYLGYWPSPYCSSEKSPCVERYYTTGTYDFYRGDLRLNGPHSNLLCERRGDKLFCDEGGNQCWFDYKAAKPTPPLRAAREFHVDVTADEQAPLAAIPEPEDLQGDYWGYLHHESLDRYQLFHLSVLSYRYSENPHLLDQTFVAAVATLLFGDKSSRDFMPQAFDERPFLNTMPHFVLQHHGTDGFLQVEKWSRGTIRGVWYSHGFGRVGTVELVRGRVPPPPPGKTMGRVSGTYSGPFWYFQIAASHEDPRHSFNPFTLMGYYQDNGRSTWARRGIPRGAFDPYTGAFSFLTTEDRVVAGFLGDSKISLFWPSWYHVGVGQAPYQLIPHQRVGE